MPSPFPGMDPYLESPSQWPSLHQILITVTTEQLQPQLKDRGYYAKPGERVWLTQPRRPVYPDVALYHVPHPISGAGQAVLDVDEPVRIERAESVIRESFVDIYDADGNRLVTGIEIVSHTNKMPGEGREIYQQKQEETREAGIHLVEIDLLRSGPHVLDFPEKLLQQMPRHDYLVHLGRRNSSCYEVYPIRIRDRLPRTRIPLKEGDEDAVLDLQSVLDRAYDIGPYPAGVDYRAQAQPPLAEDDAKWAHRLLQSKGLRQ